MKEILQIQSLLLLTFTSVFTPGVQYRRRNDSGYLKCSLADFERQARCAQTYHRLICRGGLPSYWVRGIRREVEYLQVLEWPGECFNVGRLQYHFPELRMLEFVNCTILKQFRGRFPADSRIEKISMHGMASLWEVPPDIVMDMPVLREMDLRRNMLRHMKGMLFTGPPQLEKVYLSGNLWDCSDGGLDWLAMESENGTIKTIIADYYELMCHQRLYRGKPLHTVMDIIRNMRETCPEPCSCEMTHVVSDAAGAVIPLITVDCSGRNLESPPSILPPSTTTLRLEDNKVTCSGRKQGTTFVWRTSPGPFTSHHHTRRRRLTVPRSFISSIRSIIYNPQYKKLVDLYLDNNSLSTVKELEGTEWFNTFRVLSLRGNYLKQIPVYAFDKALQGNNDVMHVFLGHNPWRCDCHFLPRLKGLLLKYKRVIKDVVDIKCSKSSDKKTSLIQISTMSLGYVCSSGKELPISPVNIVNIVLLFLILLVVGRFLYDWHNFKTTGKLPWLSSILP